MLEIPLTENHLMKILLERLIKICVLCWTDDLDELEVYGKEEQSGVKLTSYTFEVSSCC